MSVPSTEFNQRRWNRMLLRSFWAVFVLALAVECLYLFFVTDLPKMEFIRQFIARPAILIAAVNLLAEFGIRRLSRHHDYIIITASAMLAVIVTAIHSSLDYLLFFLFFPIMISIFYFQYKKLMFAVLLTAVVLPALYIFNPDIHGRISPIGLVTMYVLLAVYSGIAFGVLTRGREALRHLRHSYESNQELLVRNILMDKLAKTDALTDTYNHMAYHEFVEKLTEHADVGKLGLCLAVLDIDNFKSVNDTYGHRAGDSVLREVAAIARSKVGPNDVVARYGGEEFVILFTELDYPAAFDAVEDIRRTIANTPHEALKGRTVTVSVGLNRYVPGMGKVRFFQGADAALYEAKRSGKNRTVVADAPAQGAPQSRLAAERSGTGYI